MCDTCNKAFNDVSALGRHKVLHEVQEIKAFKCSICDNSFKTMQYLKSHTMNVHEPVEMLECKHCQANIKGRYNLQNHMKIHIDVEKYKCSVCTKEFTRKTFLAKHQMVHESERPFSCDKCDF